MNQALIKGCLRDAVVPVYCNTSQLDLDAILAKAGADSSAGDQIEPNQHGGMDLGDITSGGYTMFLGMYQMKEGIVGKIETKEEVLADIKDIIETKDGARDRKWAEDYDLLSSFRMSKHIRITLAPAKMKVDDYQRWNDKGWTKIRTTCRSTRKREEVERPAKQDETNDVYGLVLKKGQNAKKAVSVSSPDNPKETLRKRLLDKEGYKTFLDEGTGPLDVDEILLNRRVQLTPEDCIRVAAHIAVGGAVRASRLNVDEEEKTASYLTSEDTQPLADVVRLCATPLPNRTTDVTTSFLMKDGGGKWDHKEGGRPKDPAGRKGRFW